MTMTRKDDGEAGLERYFEASRAMPAAPAADLLARIAADGQAHCPRPGGRTRPRGRGLRRFMADLGGWPSLAGLAAATVAGVWIGATAPGGLVPALPGATAEAAYLVDLAPDALFALAGEDM